MFPETVQGNTNVYCEFGMLCMYMSKSKCKNKLKNEGKLLASIAISELMRTSWRMTKKGHEKKERTMNKSHKGKRPLKSNTNTNKKQSLQSLKS